MITRIKTPAFLRLIAVSFAMLALMVPPSTLFAADVDLPYAGRVIMAKGKAEGEAKSKVDKLQTLLEFTRDHTKLSQKTGFSIEEIAELLKDEDRLSLKASALLGFDHDLLATQESEDIQVAGDTDILSEM